MLKSIKDVVENGNFNFSFKQDELTCFKSKWKIGHGLMYSLEKAKIMEYDDEILNYFLSSLEV